MMFIGIIIKFIFIISVYSNYLIPLFSSPDSKGQVSYCHHFASVVRLSVHQTFSKVFSSETTEPFVAKHCTNDHQDMQIQICDFLLRIVSIYIKDVHTNWVLISMTFFPRYRMLKLVIFWLYFICGVHSQSTQLNFSYSFPPRHILFCRL